MKFNACGGSNKVRSLYLGLWFLLKCYSLEQQVAAAGCFFREATLMSQGLILSFLSYVKSTLQLVLEVRYEFIMCKMMMMH